MCGIAAYIRKVEKGEVIKDEPYITARGKKAKVALEMSVTDVITKILYKMEYRGYDSCGVAVDDEKSIEVCKVVGKPELLKTKVHDDKFYTTNMEISKGIGHNRWATHGVPTMQNAPPMYSPNMQIVATHNGTIENLEELRQEMKLNHGLEVQGAVDCAIIPVLVQYYLSLDSSNVEHAVMKAFARLQGEYASVVMIHGIDTLYAAKKGCPMVVGLTSNEAFVASDQNALSDYTNRFVFVEDREMAVLQGNHMRLVTFESLEIDDPAPKIRTSRALSMSRVVHLKFQVHQNKKDNYDHFMLKEIFEQPFACNNTTTRKIDNNGDIDMDIPPDITGCHFLACGTSLNAGMVGEILVEKDLHLRSRSLCASEYVCRRVMLDKTSLLIPVSQSGETGDVRAALQLAMETGCCVAGIINVPNSSIYRMCGRGMCLHAGQEVAVASTKAFTCQCAAVNLLTAFLSKDLEFKRIIFAALREAPIAMREMLNDPKLMEDCKQVAELIKDCHTALFLGRFLGYPVAMEGALKLKEISYIHAEGYPAGEIKHGPIALIEKGVPVFFIVNKEEELYRKVITSIEECKAREGTIITITDVDTPYLRKMSDVMIVVPYIHQNVQPMLQVLPLQLISYYTSIAKGFNPDKPRNLAKSVTVL